MTRGYSCASTGVRLSTWIVAVEHRYVARKYEAYGDLPCICSTDSLTTRSMQCVRQRRIHVLRYSRSLPCCLRSNHSAQGVLVTLYSSAIWHVLPPVILCKLIFWIKGAAYCVAAFLAELLTGHCSLRDVANRQVWPWCIRRAVFTTSLQLFCLNFSAVSNLLEWLVARHLIVNLKQHDPML